MINYEEIIEIKPMTELEQLTYNKSLKDLKCLLKHQLEDGYGLGSTIGSHILSCIIQQDSNFNVREFIKDIHLRQDPVYGTFNMTKEELEVYHKNYDKHIGNNTIRNGLIVRKDYYNEKQYTETISVPKYVKI